MTDATTKISKNTIDTLDNLNRFSYQAKAIINGLFLLADDHFQQLSPGLVADALWLLSDRMDDIHEQLDDLQAILGQEEEQHPQALPYAIRKVTKNTPDWWDGVTPPDFEYRVARWTVAGNLESASFETQEEAEAWANTPKSD
ncbi:MAG: hypothetical protein ACPGYX_05145 [Oceanobacter sp.]